MSLREPVQKATSRSNTRTSKVGQRNYLQTKGASAALLATALQDHFSRSLSLDLRGLCSKQINHELPVAKTRTVPCRISSYEVCGNRRSKLSENPKDKEYVIGPKPRKRTLAEKMGLVEAPEQPLSESDWHDAKLKSNFRGDFSEPCPICKELFGLSEQVLLSCTHVFHKACLQSFERFSGKKVCPLCRKEHYQARVIYEGAKHFRDISAIRIQSAWRGYIVRKWYTELRRRVPPKDPKLREKFFVAKFSKMTDHFLESSEKFHQNLDSFFEELDQNLRFSKMVMSQLTPDVSNANQGVDWDAIQLKAVERGEEDCSICMMPLENGNSNENEPMNGKSCHLLSCSHIFHFHCLESFEDFSITRTYVCPICRSPYQKKEIRFGS